MAKKTSNNWLHYVQMLMIEEHKPHNQLGVSSGASEEYIKSHSNQEVLWKCQYLLLHKVHQHYIATMWNVKVVVANTICKEMWYLFIDVLKT